MKFLKYCPLIFCAALLAGCTEKAGNDTPVPEIRITLGEITFSQVSFTLSLSESATEYAYAVLGGASAAIPSAEEIFYDEISGANVIENNIGKNDLAEGEIELTFDFPQIAGYTICAAAVNSDGKFSAVAAARIQAADIPMRPAVKTGKYMIQYDPLTEETAGLPVLSEHSGQEFFISIIDWPNHSGYMIGVEWFNMTDTVEGMASSGGQIELLNPILAGTVDWNTGKIVFDGTYLDPRDLNNGTVMPDNALNALIYWDNQDEGSGWVFKGGISGTEPVSITLDENGVPSTISSCGFAHLVNFGTQDQEIDAWYDAIWTEGRLVPFEEQ